MVNTKSFDVVGYWLRRTDRASIPTQEQERELALRIQKWQRSKQSDRYTINDGLKARNELVTRNLRMVAKIVMQYRDFPGVDTETMMQVGAMGLQRAAERFDPDLSKFSTYADWWIKKTIRRAIAEDSRIIRVPVHMVQQIQRLNRSVSSFYQAERRVPSTKEIAKSMGETPERVEAFVEAQRIGNVIAADQVLMPDEATSFLDLYGSDENVFQNVAQSEMQEAVHKLVCSSLSEDEATVIQLHFGLLGERPATLDSIARSLNVTRNKVRAILSRSLRKLKKAARDSDINTYLAS